MSQFASLSLRVLTLRCVFALNARGACCGTAALCLYADACLQRPLLRCCIDLPRTSVFGSACTFCLFVFTRASVQRMLLSMAVDVTTQWSRHRGANLSAPCSFGSPKNYCRQRRPAGTLLRNVRVLAQDSTGVATGVIIVDHGSRRKESNQLVVRAL